MAVPEWKLDTDNRTVTATFPTNPPVTLTLSATDVETILKDLGSLRWDMQPEVPDAVTTDAKEDPVLDPAWETAPDESGENALLHIRDPRFGWLHYAIPRDEAAKLAGFLQEAE
jgi:hypothetical protein